MEDKRKPGRPYGTTKENNRVKMSITLPPEIAKIIKSGDKKPSIVIENALKQVYLILDGKDPHRETWDAAVEETDSILKETIRSAMNKFTPYSFDFWLRVFVEE